MKLCHLSTLVDVTCNPPPLFDSCRKRREKERRAKSTNTHAHGGATPGGSIRNPCPLQHKAGTPPPSLSSFYREHQLVYTHTHIYTGVSLCVHATSTRRRRPGLWELICSFAPSPPPTTTTTTLLVLLKVFFLLWEGAVWWKELLD